MFFFLLTRVTQTENSIFYTPDIQEVRRYFQEKNSSNQKIQKSMTKTLEINEKKALIRVNKIISINIVV